jgi:hypothetical protein
MIPAARSFALIAAILTALLPFPTHSQDAEPPVVAELVVTARTPGPPWWRVTNGASTVFILGLPMGPTPRRLAWDRAPLVRRLSGANEVILPPSFTAGLGDIPALLRMRSQVRTRTPVAEQLPPALAARFAAAVARTRYPMRRYEGWDVLVGAQILRGDYIRDAGLDDLATFNEVVRTARSRRTRQHPISYRAMPVLRSALDARSRARTLACVEGNLAAVETSPARYQAAAQGWAAGDVRRAIDVPHGVDQCAEAMLEGFVRRATDDEVAAIASALTHPGRSVALVPLRRLVVRGGVIEQLRARGFTVSDPREALD